MSTKTKPNAKAPPVIDRADLARREVSALKDALVRERVAHTGYSGELEARLNSMAKELDQAEAAIYETAAERDDAEQALARQSMVPANYIWAFAVLTILTAITGSALVWTILEGY